MKNNEFHFHYDTSKENKFKASETNIYNYNLRPARQSRIIVIQLRG